MRWDKMLKSEILTVADLNGEEAAHYRGLLASEVAFSSPFLSLGFLQACARAMPDVRVARIYNEDDTTCYVPFQPIRSPFGLSRHATKVAAHMSDCFSVVGHIDAPLARLPGLLDLDSFWVDHIPLANLTSRAEDCQTVIGKIIEVGPNPTEYWNALRRYNPDFLREVTRTTRTIQRDLGELRFEIHTHDHAHLNLLVRHKRAQFERTGHADVFAADWTVRLLHELLDQPRDDEFRPLLTTLHAGDTWVSSHFGLAGNGKLHFWFPVYDRNLSRYGPGHLLQCGLMDRMGALGLTNLDLGEGENAYKKTYFATDYKMAKALFVASSLRGRIAQLEHHVKWRRDAMARPIEAARGPAAKQTPEITPPLPEAPVTSRSTRHCLGR